MTEYEKEKYEILCKLEKIKELICLEAYASAYFRSGELIALLLNALYNRENLSSDDN